MRQALHVPDGDFLDQQGGLTVAGLETDLDPFVLDLALGGGDALSIATFSSIQHQVMITVGTKDKMVSQEESQEIATALPNGQFESLEAIPHPIERVNVEQICEKIRHFIN